MLGLWQSTLTVRYPKPPTRGRAAFECGTSFLAEGHLGSALRGAATFSGGADLSANGVLRTFGGAAFDLGAQLTADGTAITPIYNLIVGIGQSNGEPNGAALPLVSTSAPANAKMFAGGIKPGTSGLTSLVPLVESNVGETIFTGLAQRLGSVAAPNVFIYTTAAEGGQAYTNIKKGTTPYANSLAQVAAAKALADAAGATMRVLCLCLVHGEADENSANAAYSSNLLTLQSDYEADIRAITGQPAGSVPMFACQQAGEVKNGYLYDGTKNSAVHLYNAWRTAPDKICLVSPRYLFSCPADGVHLNAIQRRHLGELYGTFIRSYFDSATLPDTIRPTAAVLSGSTITVDFHVPTAPLVADFKLVQWRRGWGFSFMDDSGSAPVITSAAIQPGGTQIVLTLSGAPSGSQKRLRYAYGGGRDWKTFAGVSNNDQTTDVIGGNVRDSANVAPVYSHLPRLHNWCPSFNIPVTT